ncbi:uncharacterized protein LOC129601446 [Paramacrobiotus metropolitanus]|uniref:uncharacterized protein LOC129601446 n=1 Tax=Paramacrobiotus metropolitanus TaxID=2943436 RepID=UPI00244651BB|nr:uncharacterized protein LOC129601446 [Paramacrobiotus metropolitanus]
MAVSKMPLLMLRHVIGFAVFSLVISTGSLRAALMQSPVTAVSTPPPLLPYTGQPKTCRSQQELSDLDCLCLLKDLPCRVPGSVCLPATVGPNMKCECGSLYERELDKYCVERLSPEYLASLLEDPNSAGTVPSISNELLTVSPIYRSAMKSSSKRPYKKPPFRTVMVTSNPLYAATRPSRQPTRPTFTLSGVPMQGVGVESPSIDSMLVNNFPITRPPLFSKNKFTGFHKGFAGATKRPSTPRFFSRTTRPLPRVDGSIVVSGWVPDIWPAVGLNYSI